jgi:hypothetical protein
MVTLDVLFSLGSDGFVGGWYFTFEVTKNLLIAYF